MSKPDVFLDSSALIAGVISASGAARALLLLAEANKITITISEQVIAETERVIASKKPQALPAYRETLRNTGLSILHDPSPSEILAHKGIIGDQTVVPIIVAAMQARTDYLATFNRRDFMDDPGVAERPGLRIGTPGDALSWIRDNLESILGQ